MSDGQVPGTPSGWQGLLYFALVTLITVGADYLRRIMPPPRRRRGHKHEDTDAEEEDRE